MSLPFKQAPQKLCLLRLSAIGDICHTLPIVRTLQKNWPTTKLTWIIGKTEYALVSDIPDINFIIFDKSKGLNAYKEVYEKLKKLNFDALLHMQMSLRTSIISMLVKSKIKLGFDKKRAKDCQWLFTNNKIPYQSQQHVIDSFFGFTETLGIHEHIYEWNIPSDPNKLKDLLKNEKIILDINKPYIVISPCSSMAYRNWTSEGYATVADYIQQHYQLPVILSGGFSTVEKQMSDAIIQKVKHPIINLVAKTNLKELLSLLNHAHCIISPDSGPAHIATAVDTPVVGLYATTNPDRARPYLSQEWLINRYPDAIHKKFNTTVEQIKWGARVKDDWAMKLITVNDVILKLKKLLPLKTM